jgi:NTP pyrophosphatase (non-canonical NTP hydrolase)
MKITITTLPELANKILDDLIVEDPYIIDQISSCFSNEDFINMAIRGIGPRISKKYRIDDVNSEAGSLFPKSLPTHTRLMSVLMALYDAACKLKNESVKEYWSEYEQVNTEPEPAPPLPANKLSFETLRRANQARLPRFKNFNGDNAHTTDDGSDWKLSMWLNATMGELGELSEVVLMAAMLKSLGNVSNMVKKVERGDFDLDQVHVEIGKEIADTITYLDIVASRVGIDLGQAVTNKFNEVSGRTDVPVYIVADGSDIHVEEEYDWV